MFKPLQKRLALKCKVLEPFIPTVPDLEQDSSSMNVVELLAEYYGLGQLEAIFDRGIATFKAKISDGEREAAHKRNAEMGFGVDPRLAEEDVERVVAMIEESEILDPRILSIRSAGRNAIEVSTGGQRGPLDGHGSSIHFRKVGDQWVILDVGFWIS
jgi:transketolase